MEGQPHNHHPSHLAATMFDSFSQEASSRKERRASRQDALRLLEEAASGITRSGRNWMHSSKTDVHSANPDDFNCASDDDSYLTRSLHGANDAANDVDASTRSAPAIGGADDVDASTRSAPAIGVAMPTRKTTGLVPITVPTGASLSAHLGHPSNPDVAHDASVGSHISHIGTVSGSGSNCGGSDNLSSLEDGVAAMTDYAIGDMSDDDDEHVAPIAVPTGRSLSGHLGIATKKSYDRRGSRGSRGSDHSSTMWTADAGSAIGSAAPDQETFRRLSSAGTSMADDFRFSAMDGTLNYDSGEDEEYALNPAVAALAGIDANDSFARAVERHSFTSDSDDEELPWEAHKRHAEAALAHYDKRRSSGYSTSSSYDRIIKHGSRPKRAAAWEADKIRAQRSGYTSHRCYSGYTSHGPMKRMCLFTLVMSGVVAFVAIAAGRGSSASGKTWGHVARPLQEVHPGDDNGGGMVPTTKDVSEASELEELESEVEEREFEIEELEAKEGLAPEKAQASPAQEKPLQAESPQPPLSQDKSSPAAVQEIQVEEEAPATPQDGEVDDLSNFCDNCQWNRAPFNCKTRVEWEMERFHKSEAEAKRANLGACTRQGK